MGKINVTVTDADRALASDCNRFMRALGHSMQLSGEERAAARRPIGAAKTHVVEANDAFVREARSRV